ncbi:hypothetical protein CNMCM6805_002865 [Aspergillus fumigatiaffinis]|uniref:Xylanolytic transcriptional activator regulatory domain-containing protein n=1 Tax=Aspergillus fumigatiaffinis TaxID=340414 RepID=A0A8H4GSA0_9EURO|nr:hypothetical protein CNMCM6805_002865 [Aspergillus fumigatiaffinis]
MYGAGTQPNATGSMGADNLEVRSSAAPLELSEEHASVNCSARPGRHALRSLFPSSPDDTLCSRQRSEQLESGNVLASADCPQMGYPTELARDDNANLPEPKMAGGGSQVYGATSLLHDRLYEIPLANSPSSHRGPSTLTTESMRAQLISNAALRRQEELTLKFFPSVAETIDFDGVPADLAMHLLELHWNRQHLSYLLTYRPAIMDSLMTNGPYINKLLLNAIYMQSSLYSDRAPLSLGREEENSKGLVYYKRFKELLPQYIDTPTIPTVVALLTCGACLVPYGQQSAGCALSGMAYQMVIDLGCHLESSPPDGSHQTLTSILIEQEMKKRIYWGAYVSDKFQSLFLGRPPAMHEAAGNVTCNYLDSFEEMEAWTPYCDPAFPIFGTTVPVYHGRPSHAISTFKALLQLCKIAARITDAFYAVNSATSSDKSLLQTRQDILTQLKQWDQDLSAWLRFDPNTDATPPPHQMTLQ